MSEIVYVWCNESMPGIIRIGKITQDETPQRVEELRNLRKGVPLPYTCLYAAKVADADEVEKRLSEEFASDRIDPRKAFFRTTPHRIISALKMFEIADQTAVVQEALDNSISPGER